MTSVNYWFGMERRIALYQIIWGGGGEVGKGWHQQRPQLVLDRLTMSVSSFSETWRAGGV